MKTVDEYGIRQYNTPDLDSIGPNMNMEGQCYFNTDYPIGFRCDRKLKVCIKKGTDFFYSLFCNFLWQSPVWNLPVGMT